MSRHIPVDILSDSDSDSDPKPLRRRLLKTDAVDLTSPPLFANSKKKSRTDAFSNPTPRACCEIIDDTPSIDDQLLSTTPAPSYTPSVVAETPFSDAAKRSSTSGSSSSPIPLFVADTPFSDDPVEKVSTRICSTSGEGLRLRLEQPVVADEPMVELFKTDDPFPKDYSGGLNSGPDRSLSSKHKSAVKNIFICVDSDDESEPIDDGFGVSKCDGINFPVHMKSELESGHTESSRSLNSGTSTDIQTDSFMVSADKSHTLDGDSTPILLEEETSQSDNKAETETRVPIHQIPSQNSNSTGSYKEKKTKTTKAKGVSKEERLRLMEEKKVQRERERSLKAEAAKMKQIERERKKWEKGRHAVQSIMAEIDLKLIDVASVAGSLLSRFAEKKIKYRTTSNPVEKSIVWNMVVPEEIALEESARQIEISYVLIIYEAEEFCNIIADGSFMKHVQSVQQRYPHHTICYLTNRLKSYLNKREQAQYKNPASYPGWKRPAIEEAFSKLSTHFMRVHSRQCVDEAELAEHVVGLTLSLATCQFRQKLTRLSVNANGAVIPKDSVDKNLINKSLWLKALVAIPKVQPRYAMAIGKKYPTMKSLLSVYMDSTKSVHEKEFLLKDLMTEGLLGGDKRLGEVCSKRIYRILMAESGTIKTDDVENGADFFSRQPA